MISKSLAAAALLVAVPGGSAKSVEVDIVKSLFHNELVFQQKHERRQLQHVGAAPILLNEHSSSDAHRHLEDQEACDSAFLKCLPNEKCIECFATLQTEGIDWASVTPNTPCSDVVSFLTKGGHCTYLSQDDAATKVFCSTFNSCVVWDDEDSQGDDDYQNHESYVNCTALTECNWDGFHPSFIGDGVCHDNIHGCYNTAVCGWDGGDCCEDTCKGDFSYVECGQDGWACRDTLSDSCDPDYTSNCRRPVNPPVDPSRGDPSSVTCAEEETKYRLIMYDSFGDGWDNTKLTVAPSSNKNSPIYTGHLVDGSRGTEFVCLSEQPTCYTVDVTGGTWGIEVSWEVKSMGEGSPAIAGGGAPMKCDFAVAGESCTNTCAGKPNIHPEDDPNYKTFKELYNCMKDKCLIQLGTCESDPVCAKCFDEDAPDYCFNVESFNAVIGCAMCSCTDKAQTAFCNDNVPGNNPPPKKTDSTSPKSCSPADTIRGSNAVIGFSKCTNFDEVGLMISEFDNDNFGQLDSFEACSHSFNNDPNHGGHTALGCMQILANAITNPVGDKSNPKTPTTAISALANFLYHDAESFCDCSKRASAECPLCPSFMSFKTLLYESLDACQSLDEIDCDAWNEFSIPCQINLRDQFTSIDFSKKEQCDFTKKGCGGVGPFPAFRKLDCGQEVPKPNWDFYNDFSSKCLTGDDGIPPAPAPRPAPNTSAPYQPSGPTPYTPSDSTPTVPTPVIPSDNNKPYTPDSGGGTNPKPYIPSDDPKPYTPSDSKSSTNTKTKKKKSHFVRNFLLLCLVGGGGYYYYKRRTSGFNFVRYRRTRNFDFESGESEMYSSLNDSRAFEPPTLPPTPTAMMGTEMT